MDSVAVVMAVAPAVGLVAVETEAGSEEKVAGLVVEERVVEDTAVAKVAEAREGGMVEVETEEV